MVLGVDACRLAGERVGVGRYYEGILRGWARRDLPFERVRLFSDLSLDDLPGNTTHGERFEVEVLPARGPGIWWQMSRLRRRASSVDLLLAPYTLPLGYPGKAVVSNHGILEGPDRVRGAQARARSWHFRHSAMRADAVIANSNATKADLVRFYGIPEGKVTVVLPGVDERFRPARPGEKELVLRTTEELLGGPDPYFLFVGKQSLRRHVPALLDAFAQATAQRRRGREFRLLLVGPTARGAHGIDRSLERIVSDLGVAERVHHIEFLDTGTLALLYRGARALLVPSEKESFSRPIAEAMASGCPVLTLKNASLGIEQSLGGPRDFALGGPLLEADDASPASLARALGRLVEDDNLCAQLADRGLRCAATFASFEDQAHGVTAVLHYVAGT